MIEDLNMLDGTVSPRNNTKKKGLIDLEIERFLNQEQQKKIEDELENLIKIGEQKKSLNKKIMSMIEIQNRYLSSKKKKKRPSAKKREGEERGKER